MSIQKLPVLIKSRPERNIYSILHIKLFSIITFFLFIVTPFYSFTATVPEKPNTEAEEEKSKFTFFTGVKSVLTAGYEPVAAYIKPNAEIRFTHPVIESAIGAGRYFNYQITADNHAVNYISINEAACESTININKSINTGAMFTYGYGGNDFKSWNMSMNYSHDISNVGLYCDAKSGKQSYSLVDTRITTRIFNFSTELSYYFSDVNSVDLSYNYTRSTSDKMTENRNLDVFRAGFIREITRIFILSAGFSYGFQYTDYRLYKFDLAANFHFLKNFKLNLNYSYARTNTKISGTTPHTAGLETGYYF